MSEVFDLCEQNFYRNIRIAQKALKSSNIKNEDLQQIKQALSESAQQLNKMGIEYSFNRNASMKNKIDLFKDELKNYKQQLLQQVQLIKEKEDENSADKLFEMQNEEKGIQSLIQAKRQMHDNEGLSNEAALGIHKNNDKLLKNINRMGDINNELTVAQRLLGSIKNKISKNKKILWATIFVLILVIVFVLYTYLK